MGQSVSLEELLKTKDTREYFLYPFLPKDSTMFIAAPPKHLKTLVAMELAYKLAAGTDFLGWKINEPVERILYLEQEIGPYETRDRAQRLHQFYGQADVLRRIRVVSKPQRRFSLDRGSKGLDDFEAEIAEFKPQVVFIDPFRKTTAHDENSSTEMTKVFEVLSYLQGKYGFAAVLIHHSGKPSDNRQAGTPEAMRGSSEIYAHGDTYCMITKPSAGKDTEIDLHFTFRHAPSIDSIPLVYDDNSHFSRRTKSHAGSGNKPVDRKPLPKSGSLRQTLKGIKVDAD